MYDSVAYDPVKTRLLESEAETDGSEQTNTFITMLQL